MRAILNIIAITALCSTCVAHTVTLHWQPTASATYNVYRGTEHGGPYKKIAGPLSEAYYTDPMVEDGKTYYYVTTTIDGDKESGYSNETVIHIPEH